VNPFYCIFDIDLNACFFRRIFAKKKINIFEEVNDREAKQVSRRKTFLAIDSLVITCTGFAYIYIYIYVMYKYMYMLGLIFISC